VWAVTRSPIRVAIAAPALAACHTQIVSGGATSQSAVSPSQYVEAPVATCAVDWVGGADCGVDVAVKGLRDPDRQKVVDALAHPHM